MASVDIVFPLEHVLELPVCNYSKRSHKTLTDFLRRNMHFYAQCIGKTGIPYAERIKEIRRDNNTFIRSFPWFPINSIRALIDGRSAPFRFY